VRREPPDRTGCREYGEESTDVVVRRCIECGELRLEVAGGARELAAALVAANKLEVRS
jgi:hypothetical protein